MNPSDIDEAELAQYLIDMGLAESVRGYGHATGDEIAAAVVAYLTSHPA